MLKTIGNTGHSGKVALLFFSLLCGSYLWQQVAIARSLNVLFFTRVTHDSLLVASTSHAVLLAEATAPKITLSSRSQRRYQAFAKANSNALDGIAKRSDPYFSVIESIFTKHDLPLQLKYLAVVESNLNKKAVSHCGAVGVWQLMPQTARLYGLKITRHTDERKYLQKSTVAAAKYLQDLYTEFGDWLLVVAAYNGGSGTVQAAIKKAGSRNFYALQRYLPAETKAHVLHFIDTHYYFEGEGSVVTLTKKEVGQYKQRVSDYLTMRTCQIETLAAQKPATTINVEATTLVGRE
jgi:membrane-bound lytic murein transglycosylase D